MKTLHITTPADLISPIGHSLGYWPHESLVCVTLQNNRMGATLRLDLPSSPDHAQMYSRRVTSHFESDADATSSVFAIFADDPWTAEQREFFPPSSTNSPSSWPSSACQSALDGSGTFVIRRVPASNSLVRTRSPAASSSIKLHQRRTCCSRQPGSGQSLTGTSQAEPRGHSSTTSDAGNPRRRRRRLRFRSSTPVCTKPLMPPSYDAPEESWTTGAEEQAQVVM
jgi:hypothetical protein